MSHLNQIDQQDALIADAVQEYFEALERGESPSLESLLDRYPGIEDVVRAVVPALRIAEGWPCNSSMEADRKLGLLGDFRILRQIGRGGMGVVYEAEQLSMRRRVALKVLPLAGLIGDLGLRRFHNEVRAAATLEHPHIVSVYTVGEERGVHYYAMQLIRGENLAQVIESLRSSRSTKQEYDSASAAHVTKAGSLRDAHGDQAHTAALTEDNAKAADRIDRVETVARAADSTLSRSKQRGYYRNVAALGIQAAEALHYAHSQGIVHRDIKPANLLLDRSAKLYVTDFGLARIEAAAGMTMTGDVVGTLRYMAPEQALPDGGVVDHLADVYSLGASLYELLSLVPAYPARDRQQLLRLIAFEEPPALRRLDGKIPLELELIVRKAMSKERSDRYRSAQELADDLRLFLENRPIKAKRATLAQVATKWTRRNPALTWAAIISLVVVTLASVVSVMLVAVQRNVAVAATEALGHELYASEMGQAYNAWSEANPRRAHELLFGQLPRDGERDLRGVEWYFLASLCEANRGKLVVKKDKKSDWCLSPNGQLVAAVVDGAVVVMDLASQTRTVVAENVKRPEDWLVGIEFSQDSQRLAFAGTDGIQVVNLSTNEAVHIANVGAQRQIALSVDGNWVANVSHEGTVEVWDARTGRIAWSMPHYSPTRSTSRARMIVEFSPDSQQLATVAGDGTEAENEDVISLWSVRTRRRRDIPIENVGYQHVNCHGTFIDDESFLLSDPDGLQLINISQDAQARSTTLQLPRTMCVRAFDLAVNERRLALGTEDNKVEVWDIEKGELRWRKTCSHRVTRIQFLNHDRQLILSSDDRVETCNFEAESTAELPTGPSGWPFCLAVHGNNLAWRGDRPGEVTVWHAVNRVSRTLQFENSSRIRSLAFSPDGTVLAVGDDDARVWTCDSQSGRIFRRFQADMPQNCLAFSTSGETLAGGSNKLTYWSVDSPDTPWVGPDRLGIRSVDFSPNGKWLFSAGESSESGGYVAVWRIGSNEPELVEEFLHEEKVGTISLSPDGRWLAAGDNAKKIVVYDLRKMEPACELSEHTFQIVTLAFSPDSRGLFSSEFSNGVTNVWQVGSWRHVGSLRTFGPPGKLRFITSPEKGWGLLGRFKTRVTQRFQIQWIDNDHATDWSWLGDRSQ